MVSRGWSGRWYQRIEWLMVSKDEVVDSFMRMKWLMVSKDALRSREIRIVDWWALGGRHDRGCRGALFHWSDCDGIKLIYMGWNWGYDDRVEDGERKSVLNILEMLLRLDIGLYVDRSRTVWIEVGLFGETSDYKAGLNEWGKQLSWKNRVVSLAGNSENTRSAANLINCTSIWYS